MKISAFADEPNEPNENSGRGPDWLVALAFIGAFLFGAAAWALLFVGAWWGVR